MEESPCWIKPEVTLSATAIVSRWFNNVLPIFFNMSGENGFVAVGIQ